MKKFSISKYLDAGGIKELVVRLNADTRDAYIAQEVMVGPGLWLMLIKCSYRDDAEFVRRL